MTNKIFFISDTHFGHANILTFKDNCDKPLRTFASVEEMDETMVQNWNKVVRPCDKVYHLGDVVIHKRCLPILARLNGHKRLVRGNHDMDKTSKYSEYFEEIYGVRVFPKEGFVCSHIPLHPQSVGRWKANVHGHLHVNNVMKNGWHPTQPHLVEQVIDPRYICVCVEQINYTPIEMAEIIERIPT